MAMVACAATIAPLQAQSEQGQVRWNVSVIARSDWDGSRTIHLLVENGHARTVREATVTGRFWEFSETPLLVQDDYALIVGQLRFGGCIVGILDLTDARVIGTLWALDYSISPSRDMLAFRMHRPKTAASKGFVIGMVSLRRAVLAGRSFAETTFGVPVYPEINRTEQSFDASLDPDHVALSPLAWTPSGDRLLLFDYTNNGNRVVAIGGDHRVPSTYSEFSHAQFLLPSATASRPEAFMTVERLSWDEQGRLLVSAAFPEHWRIPEFAMNPDALPKPLHNGR
jgi:hypothetical protein